MDVLFHFGSASLLAYSLGEQRPRFLIAAGALGLTPDILWLPSQLSPELSLLCYTLPHSLLFNLVFCGAVAMFVNWKIAFGPLLHISVDVFTHASSTKHLLYPFMDRKLFVGISWWSGYGLFLWAFLWILLIVIAVSVIKWKKRAVNFKIQNSMEF